MPRNEISGRRNQTKRRAKTEVAGAFKNADLKEISAEDAQWMHKAESSGKTKLK